MNSSRNFNDIETVTAALFIPAKKTGNNINCLALGEPLCELDTSLDAIFCSSEGWWSRKMGKWPSFWVSVSLSDVFLKHLTQMSLAVGHTSVSELLLFKIIIYTWEGGGDNQADWTVLHPTSCSMFWRLPLATLTPKEKTKNKKTSVWKESSKVAGGTLPAQRCSPVITAPVSFVW